MTIVYIINCIYYITMIIESFVRILIKLLPAWWTSWTPLLLQHQDLTWQDNVAEQSVDSERENCFPKAYIRRFFKNVITSRILDRGSLLFLKDPPTPSILIDKYFLFPYVSRSSKCTYRDKNISPGACKVFIPSKYRFPWHPRRSEKIALDRLGCHGNLYLEGIKTLHAPGLIFLSL